MATVRATREASEDALLDLAFARADSFLRCGTTTVGAKTGYGLTERDEFKSLSVLNRLQRLHPLKVVPTFLAAHVVPSDWRGDADSYVDAILNEWLPAARDRAQFVDVWSDDGAFTVDKCRRILERARDLGFMLTAHANEMGPGGGARMAAEMGARSVDHVVYLDNGDIATLRQHDTTAVLLPGTMFFLRSDRYAPARELIDAGVTVALSTDFNPGTSHTQNMQFMLTLAVLNMGMTAEEVIRAATLGGARALGMETLVGSLEPGKFCDFTVFRSRSYAAIPYAYAMNLADIVVAGGRVVVRDGNVGLSPAMVGTA
jgi:imidazolonepropionase